MAMTVGAVFTLLVLVAANPVSASRAAGGPMSKVFQMLADLQAKIVSEGKEAQKVYDEFSDWCQDRSKNVGYEIKTGQAEVADLSAAIEKESSKISAYSTKIEELSGSISTDEADLKAATEIRSSEAANFAAEEKETVEVISTLERAIALLNRDAAKGSASLLQSKGTKSIAQAMDAMVRASMMSSNDASRLMSLVQSSQAGEDSDSDAAFGAQPAYSSHSGDIIGTLESLLEKAEAQLERARKTEATNSHNFAMLKQSLDFQINAGQSDMEATRKALAASQEAKATAEGDLSVTNADLKEDTNTLDALKQDCRTGAEDFQAETKSRGEELSALNEAKKVLGDALPAAAQTYGAALDQQTSFLQVSDSDRADQSKFEAVRFIRDLARKENSVGLAQLASRMNSVIRFGSSSGADPISKAKSLVSDMIAKLENEMKADVSHQGFCDKESSQTKSKKDEKTYAITKLSTKIDSMMAKSAKLKEQMGTLQEELRELASAQVEMNKIRSEEKALYTKNSGEMKSGIEGVRKALSVLTEYYAQEDKSHNAAGSAGAKIIEQLEKVESDFTRGQAEMEVAESTAEREYEKTSYMNKKAKTSKGKDMEYKSKEAAGLDKSVTESSSDKDGVQAELDALHEYLAKLGKMCSSKAEPYAERKRRRDAEIAGLREALAIIDGRAVLLQQTTAKKVLRGTQSHA